MNRYLSPGWSLAVNRPPGPSARSVIPGLRLSMIQRVPMLSSCAFIVRVSDSGREGEDEIV